MFLNMWTWVFLFSLFFLCWWRISTDHINMARKLWKKIDRRGSHPKTKGSVQDREKHGDLREGCTWKCETFQGDAENKRGNGPRHLEKMPRAALRQNLQPGCTEFVQIVREKFFLVNRLLKYERISEISRYLRWGFTGTRN